MSSVAEHTTRNQEATERLRQVVARLSDDDLLRRDPHGEWTVADTLAHLAFFDRRAQVLLETYAREGVGPSLIDVQTINDAMLPLVRRIPPRAAAEEAVAAAVAADAAVAALSDTVLADVLAQDAVSPDRHRHRKSHLGDVESWLA